MPIVSRARSSQSSAFKLLKIGAPAAALVIGLAAASSAQAGPHDFSFAIAMTSPHSFNVVVTNVGPSTLVPTWRFNYKLHALAGVTLTWSGALGGTCTPATPTPGPVQISCTRTETSTVWTVPTAYTKSFKATGAGKICLHDGHVETLVGMSWVPVPETNTANNWISSNYCFMV